MTELIASPELSTTFYDKIIDRVIKREGGYVNHPDDRGGPTKYGITMFTLGNWLGDIKNITPKDVEELTLERARQIYKDKYISDPGFHYIHDEGVLEFLFDTGVHSGPNRAVKFLQQALNAYGASLVEDGILGEETRRTTNWFEYKYNFLLCSLITRRVEFLHRIVNNDPSQKVFLKGWMNRMNNLMDYLFSD